jgi:hypothetical protein
MCGEICGRPSGCGVFSHSLECSPNSLGRPLAGPRSLPQRKNSSSEHRPLVRLVRRRTRSATIDPVNGFRGEVYLKDGAIKQSDLIDGRHVVEADDHSWHLLVRDENGTIAACIHYQAHDTRSLSLRLSVFSTAIAACPRWGPALKQAVNSEVMMARNLDLSFVEVGGWALAEHVRGTSEALRLGLAAYSLGQLMGGAVGMSTATRRHCSSSIVRRMGGESLKYAGVPIPAYYDLQYECEMEILRFSSWNPNPRYMLWVDEIRQSLQHIPVIGSTAWALAAAG